MNKEWFIFKGTHHLGPFSIKEMEEFMSVGEITAQSLVWREGAEKWEALGKVRELAFLSEAYKTPDFTPPKKPYSKMNAVKEVQKTPVLPDLPDLPDEDLPPPMPPGFLGVENSIDFSAKTNDTISDDEPPPLPLDAILDPTGAGKGFQKSSRPSSKIVPRVVFSVVVVLFIAIVGWFFVNEKSASIQLRVKGLMPVYLEKLSETAEQKISSIAVAIALSLDGKTIFATTNKDGEILAIIKLRSIPKRVLGTDDVELMVRGVIKNHLGEFGKMQLISGPQFVPGEYDVDFTGRKMHFLNKRFKFLNGIDFFKKLNTNYTYKTQALIYAGTPREFEKKLLEYTDTIVAEQLKPFNDKLERLQTFMSILNKTSEDYLLALEKVKKPKDINAFETQYIKEISPILQSLVIAASELAKKGEALETDSRKKVATYTSQVQLGKQIGELGADMITETRAMKKITDKDKAVLRLKFQKRHSSIMSQIDAHIAKLNAEIKKISN